MENPVIYRAQALLSQRFLLGEGPAYDPRSDTLSWVDIKAGTLYLMTLGTGKVRGIEAGQYLGAAVPTQKGGYLLAMTTGVYLLDDGLRLLCRPPEATANMRLNDAKCDPRGRLLFGTLALFEKDDEEGSLFCLDNDGNCRRILAGPKVSNGMAWTADGRTLYYNDTPTRGVDAFDYDPQGAKLSARRRVFTVTEGSPDGMTIDEEGMLWVALWGGGKVVRIDPAGGNIIGEVPVPCLNTTSCCFGGKNLETLYITTSGDGFCDPDAGRIYATVPGVKGRAEPLFDDSAI